ncbi:hypothetical protein AV530_006328 [Patagioenas fasciata monilis]|uniref:Uncharacterized protein n=1 Tax=Patagioenas fasciata monilis TaxID=372326 RepID=A0A1V4KG34_PATFA|nr:hypothetical protein AV530_006328 [Patagioenas fasciata monilis]
MSVTFVSESEYPLAPRICAEDINALELRHSLPIVQRETANIPKNTIHITLEERFVANDYFGQKKSPSFPKSV